MNPEQESQLEALLEAAETWEITQVPFTVCMDPLSDETTSINLALHIGPSTADEAAAKVHTSRFKAHMATAPHRRHPMSYRKMYLPSNYDTNDNETRKNVIIPLIINAFDDDGGDIYAKGWEKKYNKIVFQCCRGRVAKSQKKRSEEDTNKKSRITTTAKPKSSEETCNFNFSLYWEPRTGNDDDTKGRWYFYENGPGCRFHAGHIRKEKKEIKKRSNLVDSTELDIASDGMAVNLSSAAMGTLLHKRTDTLFLKIITHALLHG